MDSRAPRALTVSELSRLLSETIGANPILGRVEVRGETTNVQRIPSGTIFFGLKDDACLLSCIMFRDDASSLAFDLTDGMDVVIGGGVEYYPPKGEVQFVARSVEPVGVGVFWATFQRSRKRLAADGLFDEARKRPIPKFPRKIGLVTSETGAVLHDVLTILRRRWPLAEVVLATAVVQGGDAPQSLRAALTLVSPRADVVIIARGGGSPEELSCFNDEALARAIAVSPVPVVSAVGHETDFTIADFVADLRAPTPSAAAELVSPDAADWVTRLSFLHRAMTDAFCRSISNRASRLHALCRRLSPHGLVREVQLMRKRGERSGAALLVAIRHRLESARERLSALAGRIDAVSPLATLARGYAIAEHIDGRIITSVEEVSNGDPLRVRLRDGRLHVQVQMKEETS